MAYINNNNSKSTTVKVSNNIAEMATIIEKLYKYFHEEVNTDEYNIDIEDVFYKLTMPIQNMMGVEAYWSAVKKESKY